MCCVTLANRRFPTGRRLALCPTASFGKLGRAIEAASQLTAGLGRCITSKTDNKSTSDPCAYEAPFRVTLLPDWPFITYSVDGQNLLAGLQRLSKHIRRVLKQENVSGVHLKLRKDMILWTYLYKNYVWLFCLIGFTRRWDVCHKMFDVLRSQSKLCPPPSSLLFLKADINLKDQRIKPLKKNLFIYFFPLIFPWPLHLLWVNWTLFLRFIAIVCYCPLLPLCIPAKDWWNLRLPRGERLSAAHWTSPKISPDPAIRPIINEGSGWRSSWSGEPSSARDENLFKTEKREDIFHARIASCLPKWNLFSTHHFCSSYRSDSMHQAWSWENMKHKDV